MNDLEVIVLAAGKGNRLNNGKPAGISKAMVNLAGKPVIDYTYRTISQLTKNKPILVIGYKGETVKKYLQDKACYARQSKQLGTGHAAYQGIKKLKNKTKVVLVMQCDDSGFYTKETLNKFINYHLSQKSMISAAVTMAVAVKNNKDLGRIVVDKENNLVQIIEKEFMKIADFKKYKYVNCGCYCFDASWAQEYFPKLKKNKLGRYDITDLIRMASDQGKKVKIFEFPANEWHGINTPEQLMSADKLMKKMIDK